VRRRREVPVAYCTMCALHKGLKLRLDYQDGGQCKASPLVSEERSDEIMTGSMFGCGPCEERRTVD
jgi:hypothetical protein